MGNNFSGFDRGLLKDRAKNIIKQDYWKCFLAAFLLEIAVRGTSILNMERNVSGTGNAYYHMSMSHGSIFALFFILPMAVFFVLLGGFVSMAVGKLITAPLEVSGRRFFLEASQRRFSLSNLGFGFSENFFNVFKTIFLRDLFVMLWTFLLVIPGVIKGYAYSFVGYILAENPNMDYKRALKISEDMTKGYKLDLFILDISFIGWLILGALCFGIGTFFVFPYMHAAKTEAYLFLRARALDMGIVSIGELSR